jgi:hypothetical protein
MSERKIYKFLLIEIFFRARYRFISKSFYKTKIENQSMNSNN